MSCHLQSSFSYLMFLARLLRISRGFFHTSKSIRFGRELNTNNAESMRINNKLILKSTIISFILSILFAVWSKKKFWGISKSENASKWIFQINEFLINLSFILIFFQLLFHNMFQPLTGSSSGEFLFWTNFLTQVH